MSFIHLFFAAVKSCFIKYYNFTGRSTRSEFWFFLIFITIFIISFIQLDIIFSQSSINNLFNIIGLIFVILVFVPMCSVSIRRLHDINKSALPLLIVFLLQLPVIYYIFWPICIESQYIEVPYLIKLLIFLPVPAFIISIVPYYTPVTGLVFFFLIPAMLYLLAVGSPLMYWFCLSGDLVKNRFGDPVISKKSFKNNLSKKIFIRTILKIIYFIYIFVAISLMVSWYLKENRICFY